jgi:serine/threonine protein kinase
MHKRHLVHRDLKPLNILVMDKRTYVISDYGEGMNLHFVMKYSDKPNYAIGNHTMAGTVPYMDPIFYK